MKMKKYLATILAVAATSATLPSWADGETSSDVLVWFIDTAEAVDGKNSTFNEIKFWAVNPNNNNEKVLGLGGLTYWDQEAALNHDSSALAGSGTSTAPNGGESIEGLGDTGSGPYYTDISGVDIGLAFLMELYNDGSRVNWMLQPLTRGDLDQVIVSTSDLNIGDVPTGYNFASTMVPEPSSGLLFLIGGAFLALRRRRVA